MLLEGKSPLALRVQSRDGVPIGEVFSFVSALYFRGKLTYARRFAAPPPGCAGVLVITSDRGLVDPEAAITLRDVRGFSRVPIDAANARYAKPLAAAARALSS